MRKGADVLEATRDNPGFKRLESSLLLAFRGLPQLETPIHSPGRVFQLRIYESPSVKTGRKKIEMFNDAGELKVYCDSVGAQRYRVKRLGSLPAPNFNRERLPRPEPMPGDLATVFVPSGNPRYPALVDWAKTADPRKWKYDGRPGILVAYDIWDQRQTVARKIGDVAKEILQSASEISGRSDYMAPDVDQA